MGAFDKVNLFVVSFEYRHSNFSGTMPIDEGRCVIMKRQLLKCYCLSVIVNLTETPQLSEPNGSKASGGRGDVMTEKLARFQRGLRGSSSPQNLFTRSPLSSKCSGVYYVHNRMENGPLMKG